MLRCIDTEMISCPTKIDQSTYPSLSIEQVLQPLISRIDRLPEFIQLAKTQCHFPSEHHLTHDESAALFLYTMKWDEDLFCKTMKRDLTSTVPTISQAWLPYLTLFDNALQKLPDTTANIWRGIDRDVCKTWKQNEQLIWQNPVSCSISSDMIQDHLPSSDTRCSIAAIHGKDISIYSQSPSENKRILRPGTRLRVVNITGDETSSSSSVIHLQECDHLVQNKPQLSVISTSVIFISMILFITVFGQVLTIIESYYGLIRDESLNVHTHVDTHGNRYEGEWLDGKKHGKGTIYFVNGYTYTGDWIDDRATAEGIFTWTNGDRYEGHFKDNHRHGVGTYYFSNGDRYIGDWVQDRKTGYGVSTLNVGKYEGEFKDDQMHGTGTFHFADGTAYTGQWIANKQEGEGVYAWTNGERYEGGFKAGKLHGKGSYYFTNGRKFTGDWVNGEREIDHGALSWTNTGQPPIDPENINTEKEL